ncbi:VTT domain-containing protein [Niveibacterium sp. SC-1]|uniref:TVP38/TMEM64 family protein n=1 Tax=Niveibacterium sp. SC-1 TaxID=3135646 RepID=UPI00311D7499
MPSNRALAVRASLLVLLVLCLVGLAVLWKAYGPGDVAGFKELVARTRISVRELSAWCVLACVFLASVLSVPLGAIIVASSLLLGPWLGIIHTLLGTTLGAICSYSIGNYLGHEGLRHFGGERINQVSRRLAERGLLAVIIIRMLPIAPFAVVNMIAGASHLRFKDFVLGSILGMLPGTVLIAFSVDQLQRWLSR